MQFDVTVAQVFELRYQNLIDHFTKECMPLLDLVQSGDAVSALTYLDDDLGAITGLLSATTRQPGKLLEPLAELLKVFSPYFDLRGLYDEQLQWAQSLLQYFRDHATHEEDAIDMSILLMIAGMYQRFGEHDDALDIYKFILTVDRHRPTHPGFALTHHNMALIYTVQDKIPEAIEACQHALEIDVHNKSERSIARNFMLLADLVEAQGDIRGAGDYLKQAVDIDERLNNPIIHAILLGKIAAFSARYHSEDAAEPLFQETIAAREVLGDKAEFALATFNYAVYLYERGHVERAKQLAYQSLKALEAMRHFRAGHIRKSLAEWENSED
jgi:tetratricopeptide (TPR) repeat protein